MLIKGEWACGDDGVFRPIMRGEVQAISGDWVSARFLVDSGADRTVFSAEVLCELGLAPVDSPYRLEGAGGRLDSVVVETKIRLVREDNTNVSFAGRYAAATDPASLDMSVLGRNILNLFAVVIDRQQNVVCLIRTPCTYSIAQS